MCLWVGCVCVGGRLDTWEVGIRTRLLCVGLIVCECVSLCLPERESTDVTVYEIPTYNVCICSSVRVCVDVCVSTDTDRRVF